MSRGSDIYISVIGAGDCDATVAALAREVGAGIASSGCILVSGGLTGVMEASCRGAREAGGRVLAVVPSTDRREANRYTDFIIASGIGYARNLSVVATGDVVIAVGGSWGTLSEIGHARTLGREVILLNSWALDHSTHDVVGIHPVTTAGEAVSRALAFANQHA